MSAPDPVDLDAIEAQAQADEARAEAERTQEVEDIKWLMASAAGKRVVWRLLSQAGVHRTPFAGHDPQTNFNAGAQSVGIWLLGEVMEHAPDAYLQMLKKRAKT